MILNGKAIKLQINKELQNVYIYLLFLKILILFIQKESIQLIKSD